MIITTTTTRQQYRQTTGDHKIKKGELQKYCMVIKHKGPIIVI